MNTTPASALLSRCKKQFDLMPMLLAGSACIIGPVTANSDTASAMQDGILTITGQLTDEGAECQALRGSDGQLYTLIGELGGWKAGARVCVSGAVQEISYCQQGITIRVNSIAAVDECNVR